MKNQPSEEEVMDEIEEQQENQAQESQEDNLLNQMEWQEAYGAPEQELQHNQHAFLDRSLSFTEVEKVTHLSTSELGAPLFNLRFLLKIEDISHYYLDDLCKKYQLENKIAEYFRADIINICSSGMSKDGFIQNLNVTKKMEATRQRIKNLQPKVKGGTK